MRVFLSSVRRGLEDERRSLKSLISVLGHEPLMFEDIGASDAPSREVCIAGVEKADAYLLILGPRYGELLPETGQSPTHEEWETAKRRGIPRLAFRKLNVEFEPRQQDFYRELANYRSGIFHGSFTDVADLQIKVTAGLMELSKAPGPLHYEKFSSSPPQITWLDDFYNGNRPDGSSATIELHVAVPGFSKSEREVRALGESLVARVRRSGIVPDIGAFNVQLHRGSYIATLPSTVHQDWNKPREGEIKGIRLAFDGQVSAWASLPSNGIGSLFDTKMMTSQLADLLIAIGSLDLIDSEYVALGCALSRIDMLTIGVFGQNIGSATLPFAGRGADGVRVEPDELVSLSALSTGAKVAGGHLTAALSDRLKQR